jgi:transposase InsO family protein
MMVRRVLEQAKPAKETAEIFGVSVRTVYKWLRRYREFGLEGLQDLSSRPQRCPHRTPAAKLKRIEKLRRHGLTAWEISQQVSVPPSTVARWLRRRGMGRLQYLEPKPAVRRYERDRPGELLHMDTKKLARIVKPGHRIHGDRSRIVKGAGWENAHVAVDDHSRVAYVQVMHNEGQHTCTQFLVHAVEFFRKRGVTIERVMTDRGSGYRSKLFNRTCRELGIRHIYTRPYTPRTNGKAERFIRTLKERWAYARCYRTDPGSTTTITIDPTRASA